jgi:integrase
MRPCDIDQSGDVWLYTPSTHKTQHLGKGRIVPLGPRSQAVVKPFLAGRPATVELFSPAEALAAVHERRGASRSTPLHFGNRPGTNRQPVPKRIPKNAYTRESYTRAITRACEFAFGMPAELRDPNGKRRKAGTPEERQERRRKAADWRAANCWSPNQLRHAAATAVRREFGIEAAQLVLGHADANVTQIYAERDAERAREIAKKVG